MGSVYTREKRKSDQAGLSHTKHMGDYCRGLTAHVVHSSLSILSAVPRLDSVQCRAAAAEANLQGRPSLAAIVEMGLREDATPAGGRR